MPFLQAIGEGCRLPWCGLANLRWAMIQGIILLFPAVLAGPLLSLLGFTSLGPAAGSVAAKIQAAFGNVPAVGIFAHLQSAGMGGYGVIAVHMVIRLATGGFTIARNVMNWSFGRG